MCSVVVAVTIGSNIASLGAQRRLGDATSALTRTYDRLASGQRINRASDDAAGLAVSMQLNNESRILGRASLNLADAQSILTVADSALGEVSGILQRVAELAEQAANGTYSSTQRSNLNSEFLQLQREMQRISATTRFNGIGLLAGAQSTNTGKRLFKNGGSETLAVASNGNSSAANSISGDGRFQVFQSDGNYDYVIRDRDTGETRRFSPPGASFFGAIGVLDNGDFLFGDPGDTGDIYRYSWAANSTTKIVAGAGASHPWESAAVSSDGSTLVFATAYTIYQDGGTATSGQTATNGVTSRLYKLDLSTGTIKLLETGAPGDYAALSISANGKYIGYSNFVADISGSTFSKKSTTYTSAAIIGVSNTGEMFFSDIAGSTTQIFSLDFATGTKRQRTSIADGNVGGYAPFAAQLSTDGRSLFFISQGDYTGQNQNFLMQEFQIDLVGGGTTQRTNYTGGANPANDQLNGLQYSQIAISRDGNTLIGADLWDSYSTYEYDLSPQNTNLNFEAGFGSAGSINASVGALFAAVGGIGSIELTSALSSRSLLYRTKKNLDALAAARGVIGAAQSRIESALNLTSARRDEIIGARSRIQDADIAADSASLVRLQISQQAAASILAQANQQPSLALQLLSGR